MNTTWRANYFILMWIFKTNKVNFIYLNPFPEILDRPLHSIHMMFANFIHSASTKKTNTKKCHKADHNITINSYFCSNNSLTMEKLSYVVLSQPNSQQYTVNPEIFARFLFFADSIKTYL